MLWLLKSTRQKWEGLTGVAPIADGVAVAHVARSASGEQRLVACEARSAEGDLARALESAVHDLGLRGSRCVFALPPEATSLRLVDAPDVEPGELAEAARWLIKDLIEFDPGDAAIDVLEIPAQPSRGAPKRIYVAAARGSAVREAVALAEGAGLELVAIDVWERALLNAARSGEGEARATAVLQLGPKAGVLSIGIGPQLYLARAVSASTDQLEPSWTETPDDELELASSGAAGLEGLLLEVQRSLDYYESGFGQSAVTRLLVAPAESELSSLIAYLSANLPLEVGMLDPTAVATCDRVLPQATQARCLPAIGAALTDPEEPGINLYTIQFQRRSAPLSAAVMARIAAVLGVALAALYGFGLSQVRELRRDLAALEAQHLAGVARLQDLAERYGARPELPELAARVESLERAREMKSRALRVLAPHGGDVGGDFGGLLEGFARQPVAGLWLREIHLTGGGEELTIEGSSLSPDRVPRFVQRLKREEGFAGTGFRALRMSRPETGAAWIDFTLSTELLEESP